MLVPDPIILANVFFEKINRTANAMKNNSNNQPIMFWTRKIVSVASVVLWAIATPIIKVIKMIWTIFNDLSHLGISFTVFIKWRTKCIYRTKAMKMGRSPYIQMIRGRLYRNFQPKAKHPKSARD